MSEPREITEALAAIEVLSASDRPTPERAIAYWYEQERQMHARYRSERYAKEMFQLAFENEHARSFKFKAERDYERERVRTWRAWGLLMGSIAAVALGLLIGKCL